MADIPTPRSYSQILGDMIDVFLSKLGLKGLKVGGPILSALETAAQSDLRSTQDVFTLLASIGLDKATGTALLRIGADEGLTPFAASPSIGAVTVGDSTFTKTVTRIYQGQPAPVAGSTAIYVTDASAFPASGRQVYIGRGSSNYEGPLGYTAALQPGGFWKLTLTTALTKAHNVAETITLAQGGDRSIPSGTVVGTAQGNVSTATKFTTVGNYTLLDGEDTLPGILVVCQVPGIIGQVVQGAISQFDATPFTGATVTNPTPFTNGRAAEQEDEFRERIRKARASRTRGTSLAIQQSVLNAQSTDESARVVSSNIVSTQDSTVLYIDDGTGYEEKAAGIAIESLIDLAAGGEQYIQVSGGTPIAKAFVKSEQTAPFQLTAGDTLAVLVGGVLSAVTFTADQFRDISNATSFEVVSAINAAPNLLFSARTSDVTSRVVLVGKTDTNEDLQVVVPTFGTDANTSFGFRTERIDTMRLYKNDRLLYKDGLGASLITNDQTTWGADIAAGDTLTIAIDGTPAITYVLADSDFLNLGLGYSTVNASNSLTAWATMINAKIPGITATVSENSLVLRSNAGSAGRAALAIDPSSTLITKGMFTALSSVGRDNDYVLDRNTGQLKLRTALVAGERLAAGTTATRAFIESASFSSLTVGAAGAQLWFVVDGAAAIIPTGVAATTQITIASTLLSGTSYLVSLTTVSSAFANVRKGDWIVLWDPNVPANLQGTYRCAVATDTSITIEADLPGGALATTTFCTSNGLLAVSSVAMPQRVLIAAGATTPTQLATAIGSAISGVTVSNPQTTTVRVTTNTYGSEGDVALVGADLEGQKLLLTTGLVQNATSHIAALESGNSDTGTPCFNFARVLSAAGSTLTLQDTDLGGFVRGAQAVWTRPLPSTAAPSREGRNYGTHAHVNSATGSTLTLASVAQAPITGSRLYSASPFALGFEDSLQVVIDGDVFSKSFDIPTAFQVKATSDAVGYGGQFIYLTDANGNSLSQTFGTTFDFSEFFIHARAKGVTSPPANADTTVQAVLWRSKRFGPDGNATRVSYTNPKAPSAPFTIAATAGDVLDIAIGLPSGAARVPTLGPKYAVAIQPDAGNRFETLTYFCGVRCALSSDGTTVTATYTPTGIVTDHQFQTGDIAYMSGGAVFPNGLGTVTRVTATSFTFLYQTSALTPASGSTETVNVLASSGGAVVAPSLTGILVGDIVTLGSATLLAARNQGTFRVYGVDAQNLNFTVRGDFFAAGLSDTYRALVSPANVQFYPIDTAQTSTTGASNVATSVNALAGNLWVTGAIPAYTKSGVAVVGSPVTQSTPDEFYQGGLQQFGYTLSGGSFYSSASAYSTAVVGQYQFTIAGTPPAASLWASDFDWANELAYIAPSTAPAVARYFSTPTISGLVNNSEIKTAARTGKLQFATLTPGSGGSVEIRGGSANAVLAPVIDSVLNNVGFGCAATVRSADAIGLFAGSWCTIQAISKTPKALDWNSTATALQLTPGTGAQLGTSTVAIFAGTGGGWVGGVAPITNAVWQVEQHGRFASYTYSPANTPTTPAWSAQLAEGAWVEIESATASAVNKGLFQVVRTLGSNGKYTFWIENACAEEVATLDSVTFWTADSILAGDQLVINTSLLGAANAGSWAVTGTPTLITGLITSFTVQGTMAAQAETVLGDDFRQVQVLPAATTRLIKQLTYVAPQDSQYTTLVFNTKASSDRISASAGSFVQPLDKLAFPSTKAQGLDGYQFNTGLIAESARIVYGDSSDPATYPGVIAAGAHVNIQGPLVRRIQVSIAVRLRSGAVFKDVSERVKGAVASVINSAGVGESIAFSKIIKTVERVSGIAAVTILSPTYGVGRDLIQVQPHEKPLVLNLDTDVLVSITGT